MICGNNQNSNEKDKSDINQECIINIGLNHCNNIDNNSAKQLKNENNNLNNKLDININSINCENPCINKNISYSESNLVTKKFSSVFKNSILLFLKVYAARIFYSLFQFISKKKARTEGINIYIAAIFNMSNLRTSLMVAAMPLLFDILKRLLCKLFDKLKIKSANDVIIFLAGLISSYLAVLIEEKSKLMNYIVLAIAVRVIHSYFIVKYKDNNPCQGRFWDFMFFFVAAILMIFTNFLNPSFQPITSLFDSYANYINSAERDQMYRMREIFRIV